eukprot:2105017-Alexandrium_andersonii.AAC.1
MCSGSSEGSRPPAPGNRTVASLPSPTAIVVAPCLAQYSQGSAKSRSLDCLYPAAHSRSRGATT